MPYFFELFSIVLETCRWTSAASSIDLTLLLVRISWIFFLDAFSGDVMRPSEIPRLPDAEVWVEGEGSFSVPGGSACNEAGGMGESRVRLCKLRLNEGRSARRKALPFAKVDALPIFFLGDAEGAEPGRTNGNFSACSKEESSLLSTKLSLAFTFLQPGQIVSTHLETHF